MPQAIETITVPLSRSPEGILEELCELEAPEDRILQMADRCRQAAALIYMVQQDGALDRMHRDALAGIETMLLETTMLAAVASREPLLRVVTQ